MRYYGAFYHSALTPLLACINTCLLRWIRKKYRRYCGLRRAYRAGARAVERYPALFAHWTQVRHPLLIRMAGAG
jgi:RNA-directed DNA polymerase